VAEEVLHKGITAGGRALCLISMAHVGFGFAAGSEAVAMPRRKVPFTFLGYALGAAFGRINPKG